ncbi:MAG: hypothetical protein FD170_3894 [Bacteroidetes bacterium]|nr:MAG: hypothetical protein FD170_3894 [Bacteroidota bacterium]
MVGFKVLLLAEDLLFRWLVGLILAQYMIKLVTQATNLTKK